MLPNELLLIIYNFSDAETKIKLNKVFEWNYRVANPFQELYKPNPIKLYGATYWLNFIRGH